MLRTLTLVSILCFAGNTIAQSTQASASAKSTTALQQSRRTIKIASGTRVAAQLQQTLDVRKLRTGDQVVLKTTEDIRSNGEVVAKKGARLIGRVVEVQSNAGGAAESRIKLLFDRLESGTLSVPITATINAITQAEAQPAMAEGRADMSVQSREAVRASNSNPGLVGGLVGTVSNVAGSATQTVGGATNVVGRQLNAVRISTGATAEGGTTLSLAGGDLRLEKGTVFHLTTEAKEN
jgi:hypothetical protein